MNSNSESSFIRHSPCPDCGSKDNLGVYTDHTHCFGCKETKYFNSPQNTKHINPVKINETDYKKILDMALQAHNILGCRGITRSDFRYNETEKINKMSANY